PAIEPSPIPDIVAGKGGKAKTESTLALTSPIPSPASGVDTLAPATNDTALNAAALSTTTHETVAAGSPGAPSDIPAVAVPALSPTVETQVAAAASPSASVV